MLKRLTAIIVGFFACGVVLAKQPSPGSELPPSAAAFVDVKTLAKAFVAQKNQIIGQNAKLDFKLESWTKWPPQAKDAKPTPGPTLIFVRGKFQAQWKNTGKAEREDTETSTDDTDNSEDEGDISQIYQAAVLLFEAQHKTALLDEYFSEDGCDGDHVAEYSSRNLLPKPSKDTSFIILDRKMKGEFCSGDSLLRTWQDTVIFLIKDFDVRKLYSFVSYDKREKFSLFPDSEETYISGLTYSRSDLLPDKPDKNPASDLF